MHAAIVPGDSSEVEDELQQVLGPVRDCGDVDLRNLARFTRLRVS